MILAGLFLHAFLGSEAGLRSSVAMGDWTSTYKTSCFTESFPEFFWTQSGLVLKAGASRRWARCAVDIGEGREANVSQEAQMRGREKAQVLSLSRIIGDIRATQVRTELERPYS